MTDAQLWLVDAFTEAPFRGNPAGVVALDENASTDWMAAVVTVQSSVSITRFAFAGGESWGYGSRRGRGGLRRRSGGLC